MDPSQHQSITGTLYEGAGDQQQQWSSLQEVGGPFLTGPGHLLHVWKTHLAGTQAEREEKDGGGSRESSGLALCPLGCAPGWAAIEC